MADRHVLFKQCFKEVAEQQNCSVTFMAKPHQSQSGSSCHVHMSMWDTSKGKNAFLGNVCFHTDDNHYRNFLVT